MVTEWNSNFWTFYIRNFYNIHINVEKPKRLSTKRKIFDTNFNFFSWT